MTLLKLKEPLGHWSMWLWSAALFMLALFLAAPGFLLQVLPGLIPRLGADWQAKASLVLGLAGVAAKFVQQAWVAERIGKLKAWLAEMARSGSGAVRKPVATGATAAALAAAVALATPALKTDEGKANQAYLDMAGVLTDCYGHTGPDVVKGRVYSDAQCEVRLRGDVYKHMTHVLSCAPGLADDVHAWAAWGRFDFNTGAFCSTKFNTMKRARQLIAEGRIKASCALMSPWVYVGPVKVSGLVKRRARERAMCEAV